MLFPLWASLVRMAHSAVMHDINKCIFSQYIHTYNLDIQQPHFWLISQPILQLDARGAKFFVVYLWSVNFENNLWSANFSQKKERTSLFCLFFYSSWQKNSSVCFLGDSTARQSPFRFHLTFNKIPFTESFFTFSSLFWWKKMFVMTCEKVLRWICSMFINANEI